jgi:putative endonuclease
MEIVLYVIRSKETGRRYIGITSNLKRRFKEHRSKSSKAGQVLGEFELVHVERFSSYASARKREKFLKSGVGREWLDQRLRVGLAEGE